MEPELFALARQMLQAWTARLSLDEGGPAEHPSGVEEWDVASDAVRRAFLAAAIVARPDLAEGLSVPADHWAAGVLNTTEVR